MNDDERLAALFRDAASDAPPPAFDHADVVAASRRITARRRSAAVAAAAVIGLVGFGAAVAWPGSDEALTSAAAPVSAREAPAEPELADPYAADSGADSGAGSGSAADEGSESGSAAGGSGPAAAPVAPAPPGLAPLGPGGGACADRQDPGLRALVGEVLPGVVDAPPAATTDVCLPGTHRYLALEVADGAARGVLDVGYLPPGTIAQVATGTLAAPTASGGTVLVGSAPDGPGPAPYADRLQELLDHLAPRL
jgi:hypothetical protein